MSAFSTGTVNNATTGIVEDFSITMIDIVTGQINASTGLTQAEKDEAIYKVPQSFPSAQIEALIGSIVDRVYSDIKNELLNKSFVVSPKQGFTVGSGVVLSGTSAIDNGTYYYLNPDNNVTSGYIGGKLYFGD